MGRGGAVIFLLMQVCFVVAGFALYFGLKAVKENIRRERAAAQVVQMAPSGAEQRPGDRALP